MHNIQIESPFPGMQHLQRGTAVHAFIKSLAQQIPIGIGIILTYPILLPIRVVTLFQARSLYKLVQKNRRALYAQVSNLSENELMNVHLEYESYKNNMVPCLKGLTERLEQSFPKSIMAAYCVSYTKAVIEVFEATEADLKSAAYPNLNQELSPDRLQELESAYAGKEMSDWDHDDDSYEKRYL